MPVFIKQKAYLFGMSSRLQIGARVEREHRNTYNSAKKYFKEHGKLPSFKKFTASIARDHLKEDKNYYAKLKRCGL